MPGIQRLAELLEQAGIDQRALAEAVGISPSMLSKAATGDRGMALDTYASFCGALGVRMDWLYGVSTHPKYSDRIANWHRHLRRTLHERGKLERALPGTRLRLCVDLVRQLEPDALPAWFLSLHLGLRPRSIELVLADEVAITDVTIFRAAELFGLPRLWFYSGDPADLAPPDVSEFADAVDILRSRGITAQWLLSRCDLIANLDRSVTHR